MLKLHVEFSELALVGLRRAELNEQKRESIYHAICFYVRHEDAIDRSAPCNAFEHKKLYLLPLDQVRVLYEILEDKIFVWHVYKSRPAQN
jgi:hypothetical protein